MPRSGREARERLRQAALELYAEQGFERTTTAEIAGRAGVTERTYFRHFADKREVLFDGQGELAGLLEAAIDGAPARWVPLDVLRAACRSLEAVHEERRDYALPRHRLIAVTPALQERERGKLAELAEVMAQALIRRDVAPRRARLAARSALAALVEATTAWYDDASRPLGAFVDECFDDLVAVASPSA